MTETLPEPASREESYLANIAGMTGVTIPQPASRKEEYLYAIATNGGGGGGGTSDFDELSNRPKYNGATMTGDTSIPAVPTVVQTTGSSTTDVMSQTAVTAELAYKEDKGIYVSIFADPMMWSDEPGIEPYTKSQYIQFPALLPPNPTVELINDNPVVFANYGFAISEVNTTLNQIKIISIGAPDTGVQLYINVK